MSRGRNNSGRKGKVGETTRGRTWKCSKRPRFFSIIGKIKCLRKTLVKFPKPTSGLCRWGQNRATFEGQSADVVPEFGCFSCRSIFVFAEGASYNFSPVVCRFLGIWWSVLSGDSLPIIGRHWVSNYVTFRFDGVICHFTLLVPVTVTSLRH